MRLASRAVVMGPATVVLLGIAAAQTGQAPTPRMFLDEEALPHVREAPTEHHEFTFARAAYSGRGRGWALGELGDRLPQGRPAVHDRSEAADPDRRVWR